jgi:hypothetical protein
VGTVRKKLEQAGDVSKLDTRTDSGGRQQPAHKPKKQDTSEPPAAMDEAASIDTSSASPPIEELKAWVAGTEPPATSGTKGKRRSAQEIEREQALHAACSIVTSISFVLDDYTKCDAIIDSLLTEHIDELVEIARDPKFGRIIAAVGLKSGGLAPAAAAELQMSAPADATTIAGALAVLLNCPRFKLQDLGYLPNHTDLVELAKTIKDIADEVKRDIKKTANQGEDDLDVRTFADGGLRR